MNARMRSTRMFFAALRSIRRPRLSPARGGLCAAFVTVGLLAACTAIPAPDPRQVTTIAIDAGQAVNVISAYRGANGLGKVKVDPRLMAAAADYAKAMGSQDRINHRIGGTLPRRVAAAGYDWGAAAENLGAGYPTLNSALDAWKRSPGHRKNLLSPNVTEIGVAAVGTPPGSKHRTYWALILAAPRPERSAAGPFGLELSR